MTAGRSAATLETNELLEVHGNGYLVIAGMFDASAHVKESQRSVVIALMLKSWAHPLKLVVALLLKTLPQLRESAVLAWTLKTWMGPLDFLAFAASGAALHWKRTLRVHGSGPVGIAKALLSAKIWVPVRSVEQMAVLMHERIVAQARVVE